MTDDPEDDAAVTIETDPEPRRPESEADADPFEEFPFDDDPPTEDPFAEMDVDTDALDDDVFAALDDDVFAALDDEEATPALDDVPDVEPAGEGVVVPKRSYCEACPHFAAPPEVGCTNPGTTIHELVDAEHFRVSNCPVVADRGAVGSIGEE